MGCPTASSSLCFLAFSLPLALIVSSPELLPDLTVRKSPSLRPQRREKVSAVVLSAMWFCCSELSWSFPSKK